MTDAIDITPATVAKMLEGVTDGPWVAEGPNHSIIVWSDTEHRVCFMTSDGNPLANARFIAWAREAVPALSAKLAEVTAEVGRLRGAIEWAHNTLWELNPGNYDHDEVCRVNDAAVEVILGLAPILGEAHGHPPEWWAERAALQETKP